MEVLPLSRKPLNHNASSTRALRPQLLSKPRSSPATPLAIPPSQQNSVPIPKASPVRTGSPDLLFDMSPPPHSHIHEDLHHLHQKRSIAHISSPKTPKREYDCEPKNGYPLQRYYLASSKRANSPSTHTVSAATSRGRPRISLGSAADACYNPPSPFMGLGLGLTGGFDMEDENAVLDSKRRTKDDEPFLYSFPMPSRASKPSLNPKSRQTHMPTLYSQTRSPSPPFGPSSNASTANTTPRSISSPSSSSRSRSPLLSHPSSQSSLGADIDGREALTSAFRHDTSSPSPYPSPSSSSSSPSPSGLNLFSNPTAEQANSSQRSKSRISMTWIGRSVALSGKRPGSSGSKRGDDLRHDGERSSMQSGNTQKGHSVVEPAVRRKASKDLDSGVTVHVAEVLGQPKLGYTPQIAGSGTALQRGRSRAPRVRRAEA